MDASNAPQNRRSQRSNVLMAASVEFAGSTLAVKMRNLSEDGALIEAEAMPVEGSAVVFRRGELVVPGRVVWVRGNRCGIAFDEKLSPEAVLHHVPTPRSRTGAASAGFKRPGLTARDLTHAERVHGRDWLWRPGFDLQGE